eukprot:scaffold330689_cov35-Prasinocladus_malaysianus.AAC.1
MATARRRRFQAHWAFQCHKCSTWPGVSLINSQAEAAALLVAHDELSQYSGLTHNTMLLSLSLQPMSPVELVSRATWCQYNSKVDQLRWQSICQGLHSGSWDRL